MIQIRPFIRGDRGIVAHQRDRPDAAVIRSQRISVVAVLAEIEVLGLDLVETRQRTPDLRSQESGDGRSS